MEVEAISLGQYSLPVLLTIFLALFYKFVPIEFSDRYKSAFAVLIGILIAIGALLYNGLGFTVVNVIDYGLAGLMAGASAVGIYELQRTVTNPRK